MQHFSCNLWFQHFKDIEDLLELAMKVLFYDE